MKKGEVKWEAEENECSSFILLKTSAFILEEGEISHA